MRVLAFNGCLYLYNAQPWGVNRMLRRYCTCCATCVVILNDARLQLSSIPMQNIENREDTRELERRQNWNIPRIVENLVLL